MRTYMPSVKRTAVLCTLQIDYMSE